jgi:hypothetical protein
MTSPFLSSNEFSQQLEMFAIENKLSFIDAIVTYCEKYNLDIEEVAENISSSLKEKLENEAIRLRFLPKRATLEIDGIL